MSRDSTWDVVGSRGTCAIARHPTPLRGVPWDFLKGTPPNVFEEVALLAVAFGPGNLVIYRQNMGLPFPPKIGTQP